MAFLKGLWDIVKGTESGLRGYWVYQNPTLWYLLDGINDYSIDGRNCRSTLQEDMGK